MDIANILNGALSELYITEFREGIERIDLVVRGSTLERDKLSRLPNLMFNTQTGNSVPLSQFATISSEFEQGVIWHRDREPSIIVRANLHGSVQAPLVSAQIEEKLADIKAN